MIEAGVGGNGTVNGSGGDGGSVIINRTMIVHSTTSIVNVVYNDNGNASSRGNSGESSNIMQPLFTIAERSP